MNTVLNTLSNIIRKISLIALNFVPKGANKILDQLMIPKNKRNFKFYNELIEENIIVKPEGVFPRLENVDD